MQVVFKEGTKFKYFSSPVQPCLNMGVANNICICSNYVTTFFNYNDSSIIKHVLYIGSFLKSIKVCIQNDNSANLESVGVFNRADPDLMWSSSGHC